MSEAIKYVVGFMFDESMSNVALIRKNKPAWQAGLLNGIGGKIEGDESAVQSMMREFYEEAGMPTFQGAWKSFCSMSGKNNDGEEFYIEFFYTIGEPHRLTSQESEQIEVWDTHAIAGGYEKTIGNLPWLVALALDFGKGEHPPIKIIAPYSANDNIVKERNAYREELQRLRDVVCNQDAENIDRVLKCVP